MIGPYLRFLGQDNPDDRCIVGDVPSIFESGDEPDHDVPFGKQNYLRTIASRQLDALYRGLVVGLCAQLYLGAIVYYPVGNVGILFETGRRHEQHQRHLKIDSVWFLIS